eukprot:GHVU01094307.1.p4 GENE.GHVU01094307.1~~GHVU01094307.1.p4  ORF type:complete len:100 (+),score=25.83 GHVU01094307.1:834-1133(+)
MPAEGDAIDTAVAAHTNARDARVLLTRLSKGKYLYGRLRVDLRLSKTSRTLVVIFNGYATRLDDFIHSYEESEFASLKASSAQNCHGGVITATGDYRGA